MTSNVPSRFRCGLGTVLLAVAAGGCRAREAAPAASTPAPVSSPAASSATPDAPPADKLVGRWLRSDADYTIEIAGIRPDGKLDARYFNPNPIHVSQAETATKD